MGSTISFSCATKDCPGYNINIFKLPTNASGNDAEPEQLNYLDYCDETTCDSDYCEWKCNVIVLYSVKIWCTAKHPNYNEPPPPKKAIFNVQCKIKICHYLTLILFFYTAKIGPINGDIKLNDSYISWSPPLNVLEGIALKYSVTINGVPYNISNSYHKIEPSDFDYCSYKEVCITVRADVINQHNLVRAEELESPNTCSNISEQIGIIMISQLLYRLIIMFNRSKKYGVCAR